MEGIMSVKSVPLKLILRLAYTFLSGILFISILLFIQSTFLYILHLYFVLSYVVILFPIVLTLIIYAVSYSPGHDNLHIEYSNICIFLYIMLLVGAYLFYKPFDVEIALLQFSLYCPFIPMFFFCYDTFHTKLFFNSVLYFYL